MSHPTVKGFSTKIQEHLTFLEVYIILHVYSDELLDAIDQCLECFMTVKFDLVWVVKHFFQLLEVEFLISWNR